MRLSDPLPPLFPVEERAVAKAVPSRIAEFTAGRACARAAMTMLDIPTHALPAGTDRAPVWPRGVAGSITHTHKHCAAAVIRQSPLMYMIGIDLEPAEPLPADSLEVVCRADERRWLDGLAKAERLVFARAIFCAKECAYKAQFPASGYMLEFEDLGVSLDVPKGAFSATFIKDCPPFAAGHTLHGAIRLAMGHIACAMFLPRIG